MHKKKKEKKIETKKMWAHWCTGDDDDDNIDHRFARIQKSDFKDLLSRLFCSFMGFTLFTATVTCIHLIRNSNS